MIMRIAFVTMAAFALALFAFAEIGLAYPVPWWLYFSAGVLFSGALLRPVAVRQQRARLAALMGVLSLIALLYYVDWTTRKPFLRDLSRVRIGMTEAEVRNIMNRYMEGTGWPAPPGGSDSNHNGTLKIAGTDTEYVAGISSSGQMVISDSLVFRHSNEGRFNSDWGIISLSEGKVVRVEFSPD